MLWNARNGQVAIGNSSMSYVSFGHGEKTLVLLPGLSDGLTMVKGKALVLAPPYRLFFDRYTVMMFSRIDEIPSGYTIQDMARDQAKAMVALGIEKASVMGVSQGGMIALQLAANHAHLVDRLVIAVSAPRANEMVRACIGAWVEYANQGNHKQLMIDTAERSYSQRYLRRYRRLYPVMGAIGRPRSYRRFLANAYAILAFDASDDLERIVCPTLIIAGSDDRVVGVEASYEMHERIPSSTLHIYEGLGHAAYEEADDFNKRVFDFLEKGPC